MDSNQHDDARKGRTVPDDPKRAGRKRAAGKSRGKTGDGKSVSDSCFIQQKNSSDTGPVERKEEAPGIADPFKGEDEAVARAAADMNLSPSYFDLQIRNYGEYAIVLENTKAVLTSLEKHFSDEDARMIYAMGILHFLEEYTSEGHLKDLFDQSVLSSKWPSLDISEDSVRDFLTLLGTHPRICDGYFQDRINQSSGLTALDVCTVLSCSGQNDLADYGITSRTFGNAQFSLLRACDAERGAPLAGRVVEGDLPDGSSVQDLLATYDFPAKTCLLIDRGFYSEDDMEAYRQGGKQFIIPVPDHAPISRAMKAAVTFEGAFTFKKSDGKGTFRADTILYREATAGQLEDLHEKRMEAEMERRNREIIDTCSENEKPGLIPEGKLRRSQFPQDRVIMFRDSEMHERMIQEYREQIGSDEEHTQENLAQAEPQFGVIVLRTNCTKAEQSASDVYQRYKKRWETGTHYSFVESTIQYCGLRLQDYFAMQGLGFFTVVFGQMRSEYMNSLQKAERITGHLSIRESLSRAGSVKVCQHQDGTWHANVTEKKTAEMLSAMNVKLGEDLKKLNLQTS